METTARLRHVRIAPRKIRLLADLVRGRHIEQAFTELKFSKKSAAKVLDKVLKSALANAERVGKIDVDNLFIRTLKVDEGPMIKRFMPRAMGRATRIRKRTSHIFVLLEEY